MYIWVKGSKFWNVLEYSSDLERICSPLTRFGHLDSLDPHFFSCPSGPAAGLSLLLWAALLQAALLQAALLQVILLHAAIFSLSGLTAFSIIYTLQRVVGIIKIMKFNIYLNLFSNSSGNDSSHLASEKLFPFILTKIICYKTYLVYNNQSIEMVRKQKLIWLNNF